MITLVVIFCMKLNPYLCSELRMVPEDFHAVASQMECIRGGAIGGMQFTMANVEYFVKGWHCDQVAPPSQTAVDDWVRAEKERIARTEPQIK